MKYSKTINELALLDEEELEQVRGAAEAAPDYATRQPYLEIRDQAITDKENAYNDAFNKAIHIDVAGVINAWRVYSKAQEQQNWAQDNLNYLNNKPHDPPPPDHSEAPPPPPNMSVEPNMSLPDGSLGYNGTPIVQVENEATGAPHMY